MCTIKELIQKLRSIPEHVRNPHVSDKEIAQIERNLLATYQFEHLCGFQIK